MTSSLAQKPIKVNISILCILIHSNYLFLYLSLFVFKQTKVPFELIGMDLVGKLVMTNQENQYICVMVDSFT